MSATAAVRRHRAVLGRVMADRCRISAPGEGAGVWNDATGRYDPPPDVTVAEGRCLVVASDTSERVVEVGGQPVTLATLTVDLHYDTDGDVRVGQRFEVATSANRHLLDRVWYVVDVADGSWSGSRILTVQEELPT